MSLRHPVCIYVYGCTYIYTSCTFTSTHIYVKICISCTSVRAHALSLSLFVSLCLSFSLSLSFSVSCFLSLSRSLSLYIVLFHTHMHTTRAHTCTHNISKTLVSRAAHSRKDTHTQHAHIYAHTQYRKDLGTNCNTLQHSATQSNTLQHTATHCSTRQHTAAHSSTLQHTTSQRPWSHARRIQEKIHRTPDGPLAEPRCRFLHEFVVTFFVRHICGTWDHKHPC